MDLPVLPKKFLTNQGDNTLRKRLENILPHTHAFDCLVGYFFISGFFRIYKALEPVKKVRILIGLKNEQVIYGLLQIAKNESVHDLPATAMIKDLFGKLLRKEFIDAEDSLDIELGIRKFIEWIKSGKLEVKIYREQNIHAKVYIMTPEHPVQNVNHGYVITGSSNLSHSGLEGNIEFNVLLGEPEEHDYALYRFNELWKDAVDIQEIHSVVIDVVEKDSPFAFFTPYELYLKFLTEYFRDYLGDRTRLTTDNLPSNFKKLQYQEDAVFTAQQMLKAYGGVFLADVVGLGKTYMSALLALQLDGRCLVITPPSLLDENSPGSWPRVFRDFCVPGHKCVSIGKLEEVLEQGVDFYKYVFIDESHRFKGDSTLRYELLSRICQNKGVILVSATPYNNSLKDIYSQLKLFQAPRASTIPNVRNLENFFKKLFKRLEGLHRLDHEEEYLAAVEQNAQELRENVLKYVMVRRTRKEIEKYYDEDMRNQKIFFPTINDPTPLLYQLNTTESNVFTQTLTILTSDAFHYARYKPLSACYYKGEGEENLEQSQRNMATFMKILLVKRLESSFSAFNETLNRFIKSYETMLKSLDEGYVFTSKKYGRKLLEFLEEGDDDAIEILIQQEKAEKYSSKDFLPLFREHLTSDLKTLRHIQTLWSGIKRDPKWIEMSRELNTRTTFKKAKLIIFTEFADTATYLADKIKAEIDSKVLFFTSKSSPEMRKCVIENFDATASTSANDFRILITTDVLAEGVNLHSSNIVINYDIPWNPSRLMQRVGRVNRVGTKFKSIEIYNFFPTDEGNDQIALTEAAKTKIHAFITLLGNDARLLTGDEIITSHNLFDQINSKKSAEDNEDDSKSELKYLKEILKIKNQSPDLFLRILSLPRKARSTHMNIMNLPHPTLITYVRQGRLDKFYMATETNNFAEELDFFRTAEILETDAKEICQEINVEKFYPLLDKNKEAFTRDTTATIEDMLPAKTSNSGHESIILKRLRAKQFKNCEVFTKRDREFIAEVYRLIAEGRIGKHTIRKIKEMLDATDDPVRMLTILRREIAPQYLQYHKTEDICENNSTPREVILSSYLP